MPRRVGLLTTLSQVGRNHRSEMVHPTPNGLVRHRQSAFRQHILNIAQAEGELQVEPYCLVNDLGWEPVSGVADFLHPLGYSATAQTASPMRRDNAPAIFLALDGSWGNAVVLAIWGAVVVGGIDNVLRPLLVGNRLRLHTVPTFISMIGGLVLFGAPGFILRPLAATVTILLVETCGSRGNKPVVQKMPD